LSQMVSYNQGVPIHVHGNICQVHCHAGVHPDNSAAECAQSSYPFVGRQVLCDSHLAQSSTFARQCTEIDELASRAVDHVVITKAIQTALMSCKFCVSIADPRRSDAPLIAVSDEFETMTGYVREEIIGKNCRFLRRDCHVPQNILSNLRSTCSTGEPFTQVILNRKKSGELFLNLLDLRGLALARNPRSNEVLWFLVGVQADVSAFGAHEGPYDHLESLNTVATCIRSEVVRELSVMAFSGAMMAHRFVQDPGSDRVDEWWLLPETNLGPSHLALQQACISAGSDDEDLCSCLAAFTQQVSNKSLGSKSGKSSEDPVVSDMLERQCSEIDAMASQALQENAVHAAMGAAVASCKFCVSIADPRREDYPLIAVSDGFEDLTGYMRSELLGRNCRILNENCMLSEPNMVGLREACKTGAPFTKVILNRKKSGALFLNLLDLRGLTVARNIRTGDTLWFLVGIQADVTHMAEEDIPRDHMASLHILADSIRCKLADELSVMVVASDIAYSSEKTSFSQGVWCPFTNPKWCPHEFDSVGGTDEADVTARNTKTVMSLEPAAVNEPAIAMSHPSRGFFGSGFLVPALLGLAAGIYFRTCQEKRKHCPA